MDDMRSTAGTELLWSRPSKKERAYELRAGDTPVLSIRWEKKSGARATVDSTTEQWIIDRSGILKPQVTIHVAGSEADLAHFHGSWDGGGTLEFRDGRLYRWDNTNWRHTAWAWTSRSGQPLLRFKGKGMIVELAGTSLPEIALLAALSWYLNIMSKQDSDGASAAVVVTTMAGM